jgi:hypothetical protein
MSRTYRGNSLMTMMCRDGQKLELLPSKRRTPALNLSAIHGEVHRFEGLIDRFGSAVKATGIIQTVCVRDLRHSRTGQTLSVDHWWFRMRQEWMQLPLMPGDRVLFTAKVQRCTKGWDLVEQDGSLAPGRRQMVGFGSRVRDLVITSTVRSKSGWQRYRQC